MSTLRRFFVLLLLVLALGVAIFLLTWDQAPPISPVERIMPDERFER